jgi:hypothetical protein
MAGSYVGATCSSHGSQEAERQKKGLKRRYTLQRYAPK